MINFLTLKTEAFGVDFSDSSLKIASLKKKGSFFKLKSWGESDLGIDIIEEGEIKDEDKLSQAIKAGIANVKGEKIKNKNVVAAFPEKKAFFEIIKMPRMEKEELSSAVYFEAENYIPLPISESYLDFQIIPHNHGHLSDSLNVLVGAAPRKIVDSYVSCLKKAGLSLFALEIDSQAISRALIKGNVSLHPVLIIDIGKSRTSIIIFSDYSLQFTSSVSFSLDMISEAVSKSLKVEIKEAEKLLFSFLKTEKSARKEKLTQKKVFDAIIPVYADLISQVKKYIDYYETHSISPGSKKKKVSKIILSGCGANIRELSDYISLKTKIPVELGNPWVNILPEKIKKIPNLSFKESLSYTTVLGLALRGVQGQK